MSTDLIAALLAATVVLGAPLLYVALGELVSERAGVINIELEAMMLTGAFCGVLGAHLYGHLAAGFLLAALGGALVAATHGTVCFRFQANQVVSGIVLNILALGGTTLGLSLVFGSSSERSVETLAAIPVPLLSDMPIIGPALFRQNALVYLVYALVPLTAFVVRRTRVGLYLTAAGESAEAALSIGVRVLAVRWAALLVCGTLAGLGGGVLTLAGLGAFTANVTAGSGFIALAAVVFGRWRPLGVTTGVFLFALVQAFVIRAKTFGLDVPYQLLNMLPYLVAVLALVVLMKRMNPPRELGVNLERE